MVSPSQHPGAPSVPPSQALSRWLHAALVPIRALQGWEKPQGGSPKRQAGRLGPLSPESSTPPIILPEPGPTAASGQPAHKQIHRRFASAPDLARTSQKWHRMVPSACHLQLLTPVSLQTAFSSSALLQAVGQRMGWWHRGQLQPSGPESLSCLCRHRGSRRMGQVGHGRVALVEEPRWCHVPHPQVTSQLSLLCRPPSPWALPPRRAFPESKAHFVKLLSIKKHLMFLL